VNRQHNTQGGEVMKKLIAVMVGGAVALLIASTPVFANNGGHDVDSGREFGGHVSGHAQEGELGKDHNPGEHQGFSGHAR
jgi:hypothetical protein